MISYRIAKSSDSLTIAKVHMKCAESQKGGFFHKLGLTFLTEYYKIELSNKYSFVLIAENESGICQGFHSGTFKAEEHFKALKNNRIRLAISLIPQFVYKPKLLIEVMKRYISITKKSEKYNFGIKEGPRGEYWGWLPKSPNPIESLNLHKKWHLIFKQLGANFVKSEVDITNDRVYKSIKIMGAEILSEIILPDGRKRAIVQYDLSKFK